MTREQRTTLVKARNRALRLSRELPVRPTSPYGHMSIDRDAIREDLRSIYEAIFAVTTVAKKRRASSHPSTDRGSAA